MALDIDELRQDVREALEAGRKRVELVYADDADYNAAFAAMRGDGWRVTAERLNPGGVIVVALPAEMA